MEHLGLDQDSEYLKCSTSLRRMRDAVLDLDRKKFVAVFCKATLNLNLARHPQPQPLSAAKRTQACALATPAALTSVHRNLFDVDFAGKLMHKDAQQDAVHEKQTRLDIATNMQQGLTVFFVFYGCNP